MPKTSQIRNVPDDVHGEIKARAAAQGKIYPGISSIRRRPNLDEFLKLVHMLTSVHPAIHSRFQSEDFDRHAPTHFHVELLSAVRGHTLSRGSLPDDEKIVRGILLFPVRPTPSTPSSPLLTRDQKPAKTKGHRARIETL